MDGAGDCGPAGAGDEGSGAAVRGARFTAQPIARDSAWGESLPARRASTTSSR